MGVLVHESCRTTFRNRITRKERANANLLMPPSREPTPPAGEPRRLSRDDTRCQKVCFVCGMNEDQDKSYIDGGLGRCEKDIAKNKLDNGKDFWLESTNTRYYDAAQRYKC